MCGLQGSHLKNTSILQCEVSPATVEGERRSPQTSDLVFGVLEDRDSIPNRSAPGEYRQNFDLSLHVVPDLYNSVGEPARSHPWRFEARECPQEVFDDWKLMRKLSSVYNKLDYDGWMARCCSVPAAGS